MTSRGLVNAHTHLYSGLAPFAPPLVDTPPETFLEILQRVWWRLDRALDERTLRAAARYYVARALLRGTTVLVDHHESPSFIDGSLDVLADACASLGMHAVLCYGATERNGGREEAVRGLAECRRFITTNRRTGIRGAVGLHASFTVSDETIREAAGICGTLGAILHVHVAEDTADVQDAVTRGYRGPVERLDALGGLVPGSILAHGVHLDACEVRRTEERACWIVQNARSNRHNRVGYPRALAASRHVAVGSDGFESDMAAELDVLVNEAERHGERRDVAEARGRGGEALVADLFGVARGSAEAAELLGTCERHGDRVVGLKSGGRMVVESGRLLTGDMADIEAEAHEAAAVLWTRIAEHTGATAS